ncbi:GTP diphosphokinase [Arenicella xantha]|uniref:GTP pyrophosphokinase n=1 Tax=Arenicella xantha TaxID=644221 RepID=A0A395JMV0_9GAMM|nr:GTP diphosphokinase [Arenicella xantha]RBP49224.1 GTP pyrophosphokinase [Arenicella xantha]
MELPASHVPEWLKGIADGRTPECVSRIEEAAHFAIKAHTGQKRASGEDYVNHTFAVAAIVHELGLDSDVVIAALLHDTVEDTAVELDDLSKLFGVDVANLVDGVTKMEVIQELSDQANLGRNNQDAKAESLRKMMLAMVDDVRVVLIKLCDRLHNMRTLESMRAEKQKRIATETLEIFSPLANRLGVWQIKWELEDLSFRYIEPEIYKSIAHKLAERRVDREGFINRFISDLESALEIDGVEAEIRGRAKHIYSIWSKMQKKGLEFEQLFDVRAVRVLVNSVQDCYAALGCIHTNWKYISGEFDDYIATPKENNYRSIHTAVIGPTGKVVEVQIRTHEMHEYNELGIAAHWRYKEGRRDNDQAVNNKILWLRQLLEWKDEVADASEFVDRVKDEVFEDRVYVFSPKGKVVDLAYGSTPIDFAYAIHTEVGHRCRGAKVNGKMVPLTHKLLTGQQVSIITAKTGGPSLDWLDNHKGYVRSRRARARIQHWFRHENRDATIAHGRSLLERELDRMNLSDVKFDLLAKQLGVEDTDEMFFKLVDGSIKPGRAAVVAQRILKPEADEADDQLEISFKGASRAANDDVRPDNLTIEGVSGLMTHLAQCCQPVPGDKVLGFVTRGTGITIHRETCPNILYQQHTAGERVVEVNWGQSSERTYPMTVLINAFDRKGLLKDVSTVFADERVNVLQMSTRTEPKDASVNMEVDVEVTSLEAMSKLLAKLDQLPNVLSVKRKK